MNFLSSSFPDKINTDLYIDLTHPAALYMVWEWVCISLLFLQIWKYSGEANFWSNQVTQSLQVGSLLSYYCLLCWHNFIQRFRIGELSGNYLCTDETPAWFQFESSKIFCFLSTSKFRSSLTICTVKWTVPDLSKCEHGRNCCLSYNHWCIYCRFAGTSGSQAPFLSTISISDLYHNTDWRTPVYQIDTNQHALLKLHSGKACKPFPLVFSRFLCHHTSGHAALLC